MRLSSSFGAQRLLFCRLNVPALLTQVAHVCVRGLGRLSQVNFGKSELNRVVALQFKQVLPGAFFLLEGLCVEYLDIFLCEQCRKQPDGRGVAADNNYASHGGPFWK